MKAETVQDSSMARLNVRGQLLVSLVSSAALVVGNVPWFKTTVALTDPLHKAESWVTDLIC